MDKVTFDTSRLKARLERLLPLERIEPVCPGFARAEQVFQIGDDVVCRDPVLIEEVTFPAAEELTAEMNSMQIKMGMLSPFSRTTIHPPKYYFNERVTAWLVSSVPRVSLAEVLAEIRERYPAHYTWDRMALARDHLRAVAAAWRSAWASRRRPIKAIREARRVLAERTPLAIPAHQRLRFAAELVDAVWPKHAAGIYHNNICPHTVFYTDPLHPRLLANYAGVVPPVMGSVLPERMRQRDGEDTFGDQSADTYVLALLAFELVTGRPLNGTAFCLDPPITAEVPAVFERRLPSRFGVLNTLLDIVEEGARALARWWARVRVTFDESAMVNTRALARASGSWIRSVPIVRCVLDVWFPTDITRVLRAILDSETNARLFGPRSTVNRHLRAKRNANLAFLRAALPAGPLRPSAQISRVVQSLVARSQEHSEGVEDDGGDGGRVSLALGRAVLVRAAAIAGLLFVVCSMSVHHDMSGAERPVGSVLAGQTNDGCPARLLPNRKHPGVYKVTSMRRRCRTADIEFAGGEADGAPPPTSLGQTFVQIYVAPHTRDGYAEVFAARPCPSETRGCDKGEFYRVSALYGLGERVRLSEDDVIAFDEARLREFLASQP